MPHFRQTLAAFTLITGLILALAGPATARESAPSNDACPTDLTALLSDVTIYGVASWGQSWVEYHNPDGTSVLASDNFADLKRGT